MRSNEAKVIALALVWVAFTVVTIGLLAADQFSFITLAVMGGIAWMVTSTVWETPEPNEQAARPQAVEKAKRRGKVEQFVDGLSDEELDELRARLLDGDGETVSVEELLTEIHQRRGR